MDTDVTQTSLTPALAAVAGLLVVWLIVLLVRRRRRQRGNLGSLLDAIAADRLHEVVVPDGSGGEIQLDHVVLTAHGILVLDVKRISGRIFGSDRMDDWTAISGDRRFTFANPQGPLFDRVAAVQRLVGDAPVEGYILFTGEVDFGGSPPNHVQVPAQLREHLRTVSGDTDTGTALDYRGHWEHLCEAVVDAGLERFSSR